jgi:hypothetical protein
MYVCNDERIRHHKLEFILMIGSRHRHGAFLSESLSLTGSQRKFAHSMNVSFPKNRTNIGFKTRRPRHLNGRHIN